MRLAVVVAVAVEVVVKAFPEVDPLPAAQFAVPGHRVVSVEAIAAAFLIIAAAGKTVVAIGVATCRIVVAIDVTTCRTIVETGKMVYRTLARRDVKTGRTTEMMCEMIGVTGIMIVIATGLV